MVANGFASIPASNTFTSRAIRPSFLSASCGDFVVTFPAQDPVRLAQPLLLWRIFLVTAAARVCDEAANDDEDGDRHIRVRVLLGPGQQDGRADDDEKEDQAVQDPWFQHGVFPSL
jgi:hypothetical protein